MKDETKVWLKFADENLESAEVLLKSSLFNPCLQNSQQCVEKAIKALLIENNIQPKKTHDIFELSQLLNVNNLHVEISDEDCDLLNSIYLPSKYPLGSALPDFIPGSEICKHVLEIAKQVFSDISNQLNQ